MRKETIIKIVKVTSAALSIVATLGGNWADSKTQKIEIGKAVKDHFKPKKPR
jgi:hypothetical protein